MDNQSTYLKAGLGGFHGKALNKGNLLPTHKQKEPSLPPLKKVNWYVSHEFHPAIKKENIIRVTLGKQIAFFSIKGKQNFFSQSFQITTKSDYIGYRLMDYI